MRARLGRLADELGCPDTGVEPQQKRSHHKITFTGAPLIAYRARLDVPRELVLVTAKLLAAGRRRRGTPKGSRALTCFWQAAPGLRWFRDRTGCDALARDHGVSRATAYRYRDEVIEVLAAQAPELRAALDRARDEGLPHVVLDRTVLEPGRCREPVLSVKGEVTDLWYSGKAQRR